MSQYFFTYLVLDKVFDKDFRETYLERDKFQQAYNMVKNKIQLKELHDLIKREYEERFVSPCEELKLTPEFVANDTTDNATIRSFIAENKGKLIVVDFWAPWCAPCIQEFPYSRLQEQKLNNENIEFFYICTGGNNEKWKTIIEKYKLGGHHILIQDYKEFTKHKNEFNYNIISGLPEYYLIDKTGGIRRLDTRPSDVVNFKNMLLEELMN